MKGPLFVSTFFLLLVAVACTSPLPTATATPPDVGTATLAVTINPPAQTATPSVEWVEGTSEPPYTATASLTTAPTNTATATLFAPTPHPISLCPRTYGDAYVWGITRTEAIAYRGEVPEIDKYGFPISIPPRVEIPIGLPIINGRCEWGDGVGVWIDCDTMVCAVIVTPTPISTLSTPAATPLGG
jgi:hypothetical protein